MDVKTLKTIEEVQKVYSDLCTQLGDTVVKLEGLSNQKAFYLNLMKDLDKRVEEIQTAKATSCCEDGKGDCCAN